MSRRDTVRTGGAGAVRLVYTTDRASVCATCGWPAESCRCSRATEEKVPPRITAKLRVEMKGRGGKTVTVIDALPRNAEFLESLAKELKKACGTGGTALEGAVELQGDRRERVRELLGAKGWLVKG